MNVEYTGRHYEVTPANRKDVEIGLGKIRKILRDKFETKVILAVEKRRHKAEITINSRMGPLVGLAQARDMNLAIGEALEHLKRQALKTKTRIITKKRRNHKKWNGEAKAEPVAEIASVATTSSSSVSMVVHKFPVVAKSTEVHIVRSDEAVAIHPMTLE